MNIYKLAQKLDENINPQQKRVGQMPADFKPKSTRVLGGQYGQRHPADGKLVGESNGTGYKYTPWELEDPEGFDKIQHDFVGPDGREVSADFTPYAKMDAEDIENWFAAGMPKRQGVGPWDKATLRAYAQRDKQQDNKNNSTICGIDLWHQPGPCPESNISGRSGLSGSIYRHS